jgi:hypothetical protein
MQTGLKSVAFSPNDNNFLQMQQHCGCPAEERTQIPSVCKGWLSTKDIDTFNASAGCYILIRQMKFH